MTLVKSNAIVEVLRRDGPARSSLVAKTISLNSGATIDAARKQIERAPEAVKRFDKIRLPRNETFLFLEEHTGSPEFWRRWLAALESSHSRYFDVITSIEGRGGVIPLTLFPTYSGLPYRLKGHLGHDSVLSNLLEIGVLVKRHEGSETPWLVLNDSIMTRRTPANFPDFEAAEGILEREEDLLKRISLWLRNLGLVSFDSVRIRNDKTPPKFGQFFWDLTAPSYVHPFVSIQKKTKPKPGFVVVDVNLVRKVSSNHIRFFENKCKTMRSLKTARPFLAIFVAKEYSIQAFQSGRSAGLVYATENSLFPLSP